MLITIVTIIHLSICALLIMIVLLQQGKGADMGATFGGGSNTLFGASGADDLLSKVTTYLAFLFMITSVFLAANLKNGKVNQGTIFQNIPAAAPVTSTPPAENTAATPPASNNLATSEPAANTKAPEPVAPPAAAEIPSGATTTDQP